MSDLLTRLNSLEGPCREVDAMLHKLAGCSPVGGGLQYTSSLDAIVGLIERDLPVDEMYEPRDNAAGWKFGVERGLFNFIWMAWLRRHAEAGHTAAARTPAIALCIAYVKAKEATRNASEVK